MNVNNRKPAYPSRRQIASRERKAAVDILQAQVRTGTYAPDPWRLAETMVMDGDLGARLLAVLRR